MAEQVWEALVRVEKAMEEAVGVKGKAHRNQVTDGGERALGVYEAAGRWWVLYMEDESCIEKGSLAAAEGGGGEPIRTSTGFAIRYLRAYEQALAAGEMHEHFSLALSERICKDDGGDDAKQPNRRRKSLREIERLISKRHVWLLWEQMLAAWEMADASSDEQERSYWEALGAELEEEIERKEPDPMERHASLIAHRLRRAAERDVAEDEDSH